jgi:hypothetical protein
VQFCHSSERIHLDKRTTRLLQHTEILLVVNTTELLQLIIEKRVVTVNGIVYSQSNYAILIFMVLGILTHQSFKLLNF